MQAVKISLSSNWCDRARVHACLVQGLIGGTSIVSEIVHQRIDLACSDNCDTISFCNSTFAVYSSRYVSIRPLTHPTACLGFVLGPPRRFVCCYLHIVSDVSDVANL